MGFPQGWKIGELFPENIMGMLWITRLQHLSAIIFGFNAVQSILFSLRSLKMDPGCMSNALKCQR